MMCIPKNIPGLFINILCNCLKIIYSLLAGVKPFIDSFSGAFYAP
jgi:hypothetical protein